MSQFRRDKPIIVVFSAWRLWRFAEKKHIFCARVGITTTPSTSYLPARACYISRDTEIECCTWNIYFFLHRHWLYLARVEFHFVSMCARVTARVINHRSYLNRWLSATCALCSELIFKLRLSLIRLKSSQRVQSLRCIEGAFLFIYVIGLPKKKTHKTW